MKIWLWTLAMLTMSALHAGNEGGHAGDPLVLEFHHRARFVLEYLQKQKPIEVSPYLIEVFKVAVDELKVEMTDDTLPSTGQVVWDPERPGKRKVVLDRQKYYIDFYNRDKVDLNVFVAHEVWETKEYDINKEITQHLHFREVDFVNWYYGKFKLPPIGYEKRPDALFFPDIDQEIKLSVKPWGGESPGDIKVLFRDNDEVELVSIGSSPDKSGMHQVVLRHPKHKTGLVGVKLISPKTTEQRYYELEFRDKVPSSGALIESSPVTPSPTQTPVPSPVPPLPLTPPPVVSSSELGKLVGELNLKLASERPWGAYYISEEMVRSSITQSLEKINPIYVGMYEAILEGKMPKGTALEYTADSKCSGQKQKYFFIRLRVRNPAGNGGYSLRVGQDVIRDCP